MRPATAMNATQTIPIAELHPGLLRAVGQTSSSKRRLLLPLGLFLMLSAAYFATWVAILHAPLAAKLPLAVLNGLFIGLLFIISHDACHGAFIAPKWLNQVIGRLAFLPSLHPFSFWDLGHNRLHHGWTNLKTKDYAWAPFSKEEFAGLSDARRRMERIGRTFFGVAVYYGYAIWWSHMAFPGAEDRKRVGRWIGPIDRLLVFSFFVAQIAMGFELAWRRHPNVASAFIESFVFGWALPYIVWNWMAGFLTFFQHTNERVQWYDQREEWSFVKGALQGTVRVVFPRAVDLILHNVMFHTAHHVDTRIPLYCLPKAQQALEDAYDPNVVRVPFTLRSALATLQRCKLYDYRAHQWLDFGGQPPAT